MTAIAVDNTVAMEAKVSPVDGLIVDYEVAASTVIYKNTFVGLNATGYLVSYVAPVSGLTIAGTRFIGIAREHIASQTSDGDARCAVQVDGHFEYTLSSIDRVDAGTPVFASDNSTLVMVGSSGNCVGYVVAMAGTNRALVKLEPFAQQAGHWLTVVSPPIDFATDAHKVLLVHETQNPNGAILLNCSAIITEAFASTDTEGVVTIQHTATTTMGCTLTSVDAAAIGDAVKAAGGLFWGIATDAAVVVAPAGKQVNAEVTTVAVDASVAGQAKIVAEFMLL